MIKNERQYEKRNKEKHKVKNESNERIIELANNIIAITEADTDKDKQVRTSLKEIRNGEGQIEKEVLLGIIYNSIK